MTRKDQFSKDPILEDWVQSLQSGHPERMVSLYHDCATVTYGSILLQGRDELEDVLRLQRRKLSRFGVTGLRVVSSTQQSLAFTIRLQGPSGWVHVRNEWYVRDGLIMDHAMRVTARQIHPSRPSVLAA